MRIMGMPSRQIPNRKWRAAVLVSIVAVVAAVFGTVWVSRVADRAEDLAADLQTSAAASRASVVSINTEELEALHAQLRESQDRALQLKDDLWPLRAAGSVLGWIPVLGDNVDAAPSLIDRLVDDVEAALAISEAGQQLLQMYDSIPRDGSGVSAALQALPEEDDIDEIRDLIVRADAALGRAEKTADKVDDSRLWGRLGREATELRQQESDLRELIDWSLLATDSLTALSQLADVSEGLIVVIDSGDTSQLGGDVLRRMSEIEIAVRTAFESISGAVVNAPELVTRSPIGRNLKDLAIVFDALNGTVRAGSLTSAVITPAFKPVESSNGGLFGTGSGILDAIAVIADGAEQLSEAHQLLIESEIRLREKRKSIETPFVATTADSLLRLTKELKLSIGLLRDLPELGPRALGVEGRRRYLVLAESADEIRASGGLVSGAWVFTFDNGELLTNIYHDVVEVDDLTNLEAYPGPPDLLATHMDASVWLLRDVGWAPHFPSVARSATEIVALGQDGLEFDGVFALTQWAMLGLVTALGSIDTETGSVSSGDFLRVLESGTDEDGRAFMNSMFQGLLAQINGPAVNGKLLQLTLAASTALNEKQILIHMFDSDLQTIVARAGWDGAIPDVTGDRIVPVDSNVGWSKVDRNIVRSLKYEVRLEQTGDSTARVTVGYQNQSGPDASGCDAQNMDRGESYKHLTNACYWNLVRVYPSKGSALTSSDPLPLQANSVHADLGLGVPGDDTVTLGSSPEGWYVAGLVVVPPGDEHQMSFTLQLPRSIVDWNADLPTYTLDLTAQPGELGRETHVWVEMPDGYEYVDGMTEPTSVIDRKVRYDFPLTEDAILSIRMQRSGAIKGGLTDPEAAVSVR
jgi:hypothetical protein